MKKKVQPAALDQWVDLWIIKGDRVRLAYIRLSKWKTNTYVPGRWLFFISIRDYGPVRMFLLSILGLYLNIRITITGNQ